VSDFKHKPNTGSIFENDRKQSETQPDRKGSALIGGVLYWVSAWDNGKYWKLSFKEQEARADVQPVTIAAAPLVRQTANEFPFDDEIPFA